MIRPATSTDIPRLVEMGMRFVAETIYRDRLAVNPTVLARTFGMLIAADTGALFVSDLDDGTVTGMIGLLVYEHPFTGELAAHELFWWTNLEHRGHGLRLLKYGEQWARDAGATTMHMVAPVGSAVGKVYQRYGYHEVESAWQRDFAALEQSA